MSFRDISRRSSSSKGSNKTPPNRQLSGGRNESVAVGRVQKPNSVKKALHSSNADFSTQQHESSFQSYNSDNVNDLKLSQQREQDYAIQLMREREQELQDINHKMHVVNEIYKDLGEVVDEQQDQIDTLEDQFGNANHNTQRGLEQLEKANSKGNKKTTKKEGEEEEGQDGECNFFLLRYIQNKMNSIGKMMSVCGGSKTADYCLGDTDR